VPAAGGSSEDRDAADLYDFVFQGAVGKKWKELTAAGPGGPAEGRCLVLEVDAEELRQRRWERMTRGLDSPGCRPGSSLVRGPVRFDFLAPPRDGPLKVLVVVGSAANDPRVQAEAEVKELVAIFTPLRHALEYRLLERPSRETLADAVTTFQPDVFHFIGHGDRDPQGQPLLYLHQPGNGQDLPWTLPDVVKDMGGFAPAFVFLNACWTVLATGREGAFSMSDLFIGTLGVRALLGMHAAVRGQTAARLAGKLYEALTAGERLDLALTRARCAADILKVNDPNRQWDWALPYLRLTVLPEQVLLARVVPTDFQTIIDKTPCFEDNPFFVDRYSQHDDFLNRINVAPERVDHLFLVTGEGKVGKSQLILHCLQAVARRGRLAKYVDLDLEKSYGLLDILQLICEGDDDDSPITASLPATAARGRFYQTVNALVAREDPRDQQVLKRYSSERVERPPGDPKRWKQLPSSGGVEEQIEFVLASFLDALRSVAAAAREDRARRLEESGHHYLASQTRNDPRPFLLILDQIAAVGDKRQLAREFSDRLAREFVRLFAHGKIKDMILVLGIAETDIPHFGLTRDVLGVNPPRVPVTRLRAEEYLGLAEEYFVKRTAGRASPAAGANPPLWRPHVDQFAGQYQQSKYAWSFDELQNLFKLLSPVIARSQL
jgi:hypothetical protein